MRLLRCCPLAGSKFESPKFTHAHRFRDQGLGFACGGSGSLFKTTDGGKSWKRDKVRIRLLSFQPRQVVFCRPRLVGICQRLRSRRRSSRSMVPGAVVRSFVPCRPGLTLCLFLDPLQATDNGVAGNLYAVKWSAGGAGFVLGNDAILLRHI